jgi:alkanesulfonate monooxygenase SsuD/methylene tetrahydromethanopterin reductase-like flavin-dependent oxidoreductase (luciferase family)
LARWLSPSQFRDPVMLTRQAAVLHDLSGGRQRLGVGAGWIEYEHHLFGYDLRDMATRMARFAWLPLDALLEALCEIFGSMIVGSLVEVISEIRTYADAGVEELIIEWFGMEDAEGLEVLAEQVLPYIAA